MIVELEITDYLGSLGAKHHYAHLRWERPGKDGDAYYNTLMRGEVYGKTSKKDADYINKLGWSKDKVKAGDTCFGWLTEEETIKHGVEKFIETFDTEKDILVMYPGGNGGVCVVMVGPESLKKKIKPWSDACEAMGWDWGDKTYPKMRKIDKEFHEFWDKYKKRHKPRDVEYDEWSFRGKDLIDG